MTTADAARLAPTKKRKPAVSAAPALAVPGLAKGKTARPRVAAAGTPRAPHSPALAEVRRARAAIAAQPKVAARGQPVKKPPGAIVEPAHAGDHHAIHQFLVAVFNAPSRDRFLSSLDDPFYEPSDRLVARCDSLVVSHVHLSRRVWHVGGTSLPATGLHWMGTLPEYRHQGHARRLLRFAQRQMAADGALMGYLRTSVPYFFRREGWAVCGRHSVSRASTRDVLAQLSRHCAALDFSGSQLTIRPWRQVELPALMRIYNRNAARRAGAVERTEAYWRWLISCRAFDQVLVAIRGPDKMELGDDQAAIVGYVIRRGDQIMELMVEPSVASAGPALLARACGEALEEDLNLVALQAPANDPLHALFVGAGGAHHQRELHQGEVFMVKLLDRAAVLERLAGTFQQRALAARLPSPGELGLLVDSDKLRLVLSARGVKIASGRVGRSYLRCSSAEFTRLALGHLDIDEAIDAGRIECSTRLARELAQGLFPQFPLWRSPLDEALL